VPKTSGNFCHQQIQLAAKKVTDYPTSPSP